MKYDIREPRDPCPAPNGDLAAEADWLTRFRARCDALKLRWECGPEMPGCGWAIRARDANGAELGLLAPTCADGGYPVLYWEGAYSPELCGALTVPREERTIPAWRIPIDAQEAVDAAFAEQAAAERCARCGGKMSDHDKPLFPADGDCGRPPQA